MIIALVGEKGCLITCLLKGRDDSFLMVDGVEVTSCNIRHQHGYAFMGGIRLCQDFGERNNSRLTGQKRIRLPLISVELPVQCAGSLSHYHYIHFTLVRRMSGLGMESKIFRGMMVILRQCRPLKSKSHIIAYIERIKIGFQFIAGVFPVSSAQGEKRDSKQDEGSLPFSANKCHRKPALADN